MVDLIDPPMPTVATKIETMYVAVCGTSGEENSVVGLG